MITIEKDDDLRTFEKKDIFYIFLDVYKGFELALKDDAIHDLLQIRRNKEVIFDDEENDYDTLDIYIKDRKIKVEISKQGYNLFTFEALTDNYSLTVVTDKDDEEEEIEEEFTTANNTE